MLAKSFRLGTLVLVSSLACGRGDPKAGGEARADVKPAGKGPVVESMVAKAPSRGPEHTVFSLADNCYLAHV